MDEMGADQRSNVLGWSPPEPAGTGYRSTVDRARWVYTAIAAFTIVSLVSIWLEIDELAILDRLLGGEPVIAEWDASRANQEMAYWLYLATYVFVAVTFLTWLYLAHRNLSAFDADPRHGTRGVLGWWFVPFANLVQPYRVVSELARLSAFDRAFPTILLWGWWALWIVGGIAGGSLRSIFDPASFQEVRDALVRTIASDALLTGAGLALGAVVWWITTQQERRSATTAAAASSPIVPAGADGARVAWAAGSVALLGLVIVLLIPSVAQRDDSSPVGGVGEGEGPAGSGERGGRVSIFDLDVGECTDDSLEGPIITVDLVDCASPHSAEVYAVFDHPAGRTEPYPGDDEIGEYAWEGCLARFEPFTGEPYETSPLEIYYLHPQRLSWSGNDREVLCLVADVDGQMLRGSARDRGAGATPVP